MVLPGKFRETKNLLRHHAYREHVRIVPFPVPQVKFVKHIRITILVLPIRDQSGIHRDGEDKVPFLQFLCKINKAKANSGKIARAPRRTTNILNDFIQVRQVIVSNDLDLWIVRHVTLEYHLVTKSVVVDFHLSRNP